MVAVSAPAGMPHRMFSPLIVGAVWPFTDPESFETASEAEQAQGLELQHAADGLRQTAQTVGADQSGHAVDGFCQALNRWAAEFYATADEFFAVARATHEIAWLIDGLRQDLDQIDMHAHEEIQQLMKQEQLLGSAAMWEQIFAVIDKARAAAETKAHAAEAAIVMQGQNIGINQPAPQTGAGTDPGDPSLPDLQNGGFGFGGGPNPKTGGMPTGFGNFPMSPAPADKPRPQIGPQRDGGLQPPDGSNVPGDTPQPVGAGDGPSGPKTHRPQMGADRDPGSMVPPLPFGGSSGGGGVPSPSGGGLGGGVPGGGAFKLPETPGGLGGLGGGGGLPQGLTPTNFSPGGAGVPPTTAAPTDFTRGFGAGLGGAPPPLASPVTPPPSAASTSAGLPAGYSPGPSPVAASGGVPVAPATPAVTPPAVSGGAGLPAGPVGPLPPFGSDVARTAAAGAAVTPSAGAPLTSTPTAGGPGAGGPVAPIPPGVMTTGVGASAGAANEGIRSAKPDPLLDSASQLLYQLVHACQKKKYFLMDWCVGVFRTQSGVETVVVNSEGAGYIPTGVFVPRTARMLFADASLNAEFRQRWFSWANPAETMLAYAELATKNNPSVELWALAVSTSYGGSSGPARAAGVPQCEECPVDLSPIKDTDPALPLDEKHMHRLETINRALYARLTGFGDGPLPDRSEAWRTTMSAAELALGRASAIRDLSVPPVIREVLELLSKGLRVPQEKWTALESAYLGNIGMASALRPGLAGNAGPGSTHVLAQFALARLIEMLLLWNLDDTTDRSGIKYPEIAYLATQIDNSPQELN